MCAPRPTTPNPPHECRCEVCGAEMPTAAHDRLKELCRVIEPFAAIAATSRAGFDSWAVYQACREMRPLIYS